MITKAMATWTLLVRLVSPIYPEEHRLWDQNYGPIETPQQCESLAKQNWVKLYNHYSQDLSSLAIQYNTTCQAHVGHKVWKLFISCNREKICETKRYEGID